MRYITVVERIGEWLGPVDWSYDFSQHGPPRSVVNPKCIEEGIAVLRLLDAALPDLEGWRYCPSGWSTFEIVQVGMYDGWPFWAPTPTVGYIGPLNCVERTSFYDLSSYNTRKHAPKTQ